MQLTLIIPCYNEEANIQKGVLDNIGNFTKDDVRFGEVLIVDDGSSDNSREIIKRKYLALFPKFRLVENAHQGKAYAIIRGFEEAKFEYVMFSDIDLATPLEESDKLIAEVDNGYEVVIGSRDSHREGAPLTRKIMAVGMIVVRNYIIGLKGIRDTQCGFKLFKRDAALEILKRLRVFKRQQTITGSSVSAGFDLEFLFLAQKLGYKIKEIPVIWRHVETKNVNFLKDSIETIKDIVRIKTYDISKKYSQ
jgi:dolichyl-phosphate beta-glucosyltransferase